MKLYTKAGDRGTTSLKYGSTMKKSDDRIELLGAIDELNSHIGLAKVLVDDDMKKKLSKLQENLIFLMYGISDPRNRSYRFPDSHVLELEQEIDKIESSFSREKKFVLYGGCELSARLDVACTVARRAERRFVKMKLVYGGDMAAMQFMNRISDYLYILARYADYLNEQMEHHEHQAGHECKCGNHGQVKHREHQPDHECEKYNQEEHCKPEEKKRVTEKEVTDLVAELLKKLNL